MEVKVLSGQCLYDVSIQHTGIAINAQAIARANSLQLMEKLTPGQILIIPDTIEKDQKVLQYYGAREILPATALSNLTTTSPFEYEFPQGELPASL